MVLHNFPGEPPDRYCVFPRSLLNIAFDGIPALYFRGPEFASLLE
jgi:hypothetical protein